MAEREPIFTKRFTAEFNTSQDTLRQLATMEWNIDEIFRQVYSNGLDKNDIPMIKTLYHYIVFIYADRLWSMSWTILQEDKDNDKADTFTKFEKELKILYDDWINKNKDKIPTALVERLREYKRWLYEVKQKRIKLGIPTREESSGLERLRKAAGV